MLHAFVAIHRDGDLIVLGDRDTVFGELDSPSEPLPPEYGAHGSLHEMDIPLIVYNARERLNPEDFQYNRDLARWLTRLKPRLTSSGSRSPG